MTERRRRTILGAIAGVGGLVGTAGCLGVLGGDDAGTTTDGSNDGATTGETSDAGTTTSGNGGAGATTATEDGESGGPGPADGTDDGEGSGDGAGDGTESSDGAAGSFGSPADWAPRSSALGTERLSVGYTDNASVRDHADRLPARTVAVLRRFVASHASRVGLGPDPVDHDLQLAPTYDTGDTVSSAPITVLAGEFSGEAVLENEPLSGYEPAGTHRGYDLHAGSSAAVALGEGVALWAPGLERTGPEYLRAVLDARAGDGRLVGTSADARLALDGLASVDFLQARTAPWAERTPPSYLEGSVAFARAFSFEGSTTRLEWRFVFETADGIDAAAIRSGAAEDQPGLSTYDFGVEVEDRVAVLSGTTPTEEFDLLSEGTP